MALFGSKQKVGFMNVIRCDEESYLIWKWHPANVEAGTNKRENEIRNGSPLRIRNGEVAVFIYNQGNDTYQDFIEGPYDGVLKTKNLPVISSVIGKFFNDSSPFQAEVYFINVSGLVQSKFGVPFFDVFDPRFEDYSVPIAVRGVISYRIQDYRHFFKYYRSMQLTTDAFDSKIAGVVSRVVKSKVTTAPSDYNVTAIQLDRVIEQLNTAVERVLKTDLEVEFGIQVVTVDISDIVIDKYSDGYNQLMAVTQHIQTATMKAQAAANIKDIADQQRIEAENKEATLKLQREEAQYQMHLQSQMNNLAAHQINQQAAVGIAGAEALGQFGANAGNGDISGGGLNPAAIMAGMALGSTIGQNLSGSINNMMSGSVQQIGTPGAVPPPINVVKYHVVVNDTATGPYTIQELASMAVSGQLTRNSLVWTQGMPQWKTAASVEDLMHLFVPDIPKG